MWKAYTLLEMNSCCNQSQLRTTVSAGVRNSECTYVALRFTNQAILLLLLLLLLLFLIIMSARHPRTLIPPSLLLLVLLLLQY